jgi:predicted nucleic acid-binding protein
MIKIYIDCNILIDWLLEREPYSYYAAQVIQLTEERKIQSFVSALTLSNTYYLIKKELNKRIADEFIKDSLTLFHFSDMSENIIKQTIKNRYKDFEDDLHYFSAMKCSIDYFITRNKKDFRNDKVNIIDAEEFIKHNFKG